MIISQFLTDCLERKPGSFRDFVICTLEEVYARSGGSSERTMAAYQLLYQRLDWASQGSEFSAWLDQVLGPVSDDCSKPDPELVEHVVEATGAELRSKAPPCLSERLAELAVSGFLLWLPLVLVSAYFVSAPRPMAIAVALTLTLALYPLQGRLGARWVRSRCCFLFLPIISSSVLFATIYASTILKSLSLEDGSLPGFLERLDVQLQGVSKVEFLLLTLFCAFLLLLVRALVGWKPWVAPKRTHPLTFGLPILISGLLTVPLGFLVSAPVLKGEVRERVYEVWNRPAEDSERCCWAHEAGPLRSAFRSAYFVEKPKTLSCGEFWLELGSELFSQDDWPASREYQENLDFFSVDVLYRDQEFELAHAEVALRLLQSRVDLTAKDMSWIWQGIAKLPPVTPEELRRLRALSLDSFRYIKLAPEDWDSQVNDFLYEESRWALFGEKTLEDYKPDSIWPVRRFSLSRDYARVHRIWSWEKRYRQQVTLASPLPLEAQLKMHRGNSSPHGPVGTRLRQEERRRLLHLIALELYLKELECESESPPVALEDLPPDLQASVEALDGTLLYESGRLNYTSPLERE